MFANLYQADFSVLFNKQCFHIEESIYQKLLLQDTNLTKNGDNKNFAKQINWASLIGKLGLQSN